MRRRGPRRCGVHRLPEPSMNGRITKLSAVLLVVLFGSPFALPQSQPKFAPDKMDNVLYGVAYYTEYMPYDRLGKDVEMMRQAGISVVRIGESSWGLWEPEDGHFEFAWMDRVVERMQ